MVCSTKKFLAVFLVIFFAELLIMFVIGRFIGENLWENFRIMLIDSVTLSLIVTPVLYYVLVKPLEKTLKELKVLKGLMSVCSVCKKVNPGGGEDAEEWVEIEKYIQENSEMLFSHGFCPDCYKETMHLINNYKKGLEKFLETLPEQSVQLGSEMIQVLTLNSKNQIANLEAIEKSLLRPAKSELS